MQHPLHFLACGDALHIDLEVGGSVLGIGCLREHLIEI